MGKNLKQKEVFPKGKSNFNHAIPTQLYFLNTVPSPKLSRVLFLPHGSHHFPIWFLFANQVVIHQSKMEWEEKIAKFKF